MKGIIIGVLCSVFAIACSRTNGGTSRRAEQHFMLGSAQGEASLVLFDVKTHQPNLYEEMKGHWVKFGHLAELNKESYGSDFSRIVDFRYIKEIEVLVGSEGGGDPIEVRAIDCDDPTKYRTFDDP